MKKYYVYEHWLNGKCIYVGKGSNDRAFSYRKIREWQKHFNYDMFEWFRVCYQVVKVVEYFDNEQDAYKFERELSIQRRNEGHPLTNNADGKAVIFTDKQKEHFSKITSGENNPMYGKKHSEEAKLRQSKSAKNRHYNCICKICKSSFKGKSWNQSKCNNCKN